MQDVDITTPIQLPLTLIRSVSTFDPRAMILPYITLFALVLATQIVSVGATQLEVRQDITQGIPRFNPFASDNLAVYFGHSPNSRNASLPVLCNNPSINIIIFGFVTAFNGPENLPLFQFTATCSARSRKGLCPTLAAQIQSCQSLGKRVFISIGGSVSNASFTSQQDATDAANTMWDFFGEGTGALNLRPFGNVSVDGFDFGKLQDLPSCCFPLTSRIRKLTLWRANVSIHISL